MVAGGRGDAYPGAYRDGRAGSIYPEVPYDTDALAVLCRRQRAAAWQGPQSLETGVVSWIVGYRLDAYLAPDMQVERAKTRTPALCMLKHGRIADYLDARHEIRHLLEDPPITLHRSRYAWRDAVKMPMYVAFDDSPRGRHFRAIWTTRFRKLRHDGTIADSTTATASTSGHSRSRAIGPGRRRGRARFPTMRWSPSIKCQPNWKHKHDIHLFDKN